MKKLLGKQWGPWCEWCRPKTTRATHRSRGFYHYSCDDHTDELTATESDDDRMTEADHQTWGRL